MGLSERKETKELKTNLKYSGWKRPKSGEGPTIKPQILNMMNLHIQSTEGHAITKSQNLRKNNFESSESSDSSDTREPLLDSQQIS